MKFQVVFLLAVCAFSSIRGQSADTRFLLWTRRNPTTPYELITGNAANLAASNYDATKPTKIFAHGWRQNGYASPAVLDMRDAFLANQDCNFIAVDWENLASNLNYYAAAPNVVPVGQLTGALVNFLVRQGSVLSRFHYIGFSLGAHVAGAAGASTTGTVPRITGLDPAFPSFSMDDPSTRLDTTDAAFVDVIHTNSGTLLENCLSFPYSIGTVDFWPNGGSSQPGCAGNGPNLIDMANGCSHGRAPEYFTESINGSPAFTSTKCTSYANFESGACTNNAKTSMGFPVPTTVSGDYYLNTNSASPYARG